MLYLIEHFIKQENPFLLDAFFPLHVKHLVPMA